MKEFETILQKGLTEGLRKFEESVGFEDRLVECHNLMVTERGLRIHEAITLMSAS